MNRLTKVPVQVFAFSNLVFLELSSNRIAVLPLEIGLLRQLRWLNLSSNRFTALPPELGALVNLETLSLYDNDLVSLPPNLIRLARLSSLCLKHNERLPQKFRVDFDNYDLVKAGLLDIFAFYNDGVRTAVYATALLRLRDGVWKSMPRDVLRIILRQLLDGANDTVWLRACTKVSQPQETKCSLM